MHGALRLLFACLVVAVGALAGCSSEDSTPGGSPASPLGTGVVARIEISPRGALLTPEASSQTFEAKAFDAENRPIEATFVWSSNAGDVVSVAADGSHSARATAQKALGSALITAEAGGLQVSAVAVAAEPAAGAILLRDDQIIGLPTAVDERAPFGRGYRYKVEVSPGLGAPVGAVVVSTGAKAVAGRIVAVEPTSITVEQVALREALPRLDIRQKLDLTAGGAGSLPTKTQSRGARGGLTTLAEKEFTVAGLECKAEGALGALEFTKKDVALSALNGLTYDLVWNDDEKNIVVSGEPKVTFELEAVVKGELEGKVTCLLTLKEYVIPLPGVLGIFLGAVVPVGLGFEVGAKAVVTQAGVNLKGDASAKVSFGFRCLAGACTGVTEAETSGSLTPKWIPPDLDLLATRFEPEAQVFAWAKLEGGARFSSTLRFDAIEAQAGLKLTGSFASEEAQAKADDYSSSYALAFVASAGPAGAAESFLNLVEVAVGLLQLEKEIPLGDSPTGVTLTASVDSFKIGDQVRFKLSLDPKRATFPVIGYNVESVRVYRKTLRDDGSISLVLANEVLPQGEQLDIEIPWVATIDGDVADGFVAFVKTRPLDLRIEAATTVPGGLTLPDGTKRPVSDAQSYVDQENIARALMYFTKNGESFFACNKHEQKAGAERILLAINRPGALTPGTYAFGPGTDSDLFAGGFTPEAPGCASLGQTRTFTSGTLVLTSGPIAGLAGTATLVGADGTTTGTFAFAPCQQTLAQVTSAPPNTCVP